MAAGVLAERGLSVILCDAMPSVGRKFLMAGKSGLNLTKDEPFEPFLQAFSEAGDNLASIFMNFDAEAVQAWARELGQEIFSGSTGRVFPVAMKASPLLRAWMMQLANSGVEVRTRWRWIGWQGQSLLFETPDGKETLASNVTVLALGGASWARLGATGSWSNMLEARGIQMAGFAPANSAVSVDWSEYMQPHFGRPLKNVLWSSGPYHSRGEAVISRNGLEGGGIYSVSRGVREGNALLLDFRPDLTQEDIQLRLAKPKGKASLANHLRKLLRLTPAEIALLQEMARPLPKDPSALAAVLKGLPISNAGLRPMDEAISTAGGVPFSELTDGLMLRSLPGTFAAGEMLNWEAPTGGYLISGCLATGRWAGQHAADWALNQPA